VYIVTSSLSKAQVEAEFEKLANGGRPLAHFVQLYSLLMTYFSACSEMGAVGFVACRPYTLESAVKRLTNFCELPPKARVLTTELRRQLSLLGSFIGEFGVVLAQLIVRRLETLRLVKSPPHDISKLLAWRQYGDVFVAPGRALGIAHRHAAGQARGFGVDTLVITRGSKVIIEPINHIFEKADCSHLASPWFSASRCKTE
jgi:hypothetical protein